MELLAGCYIISDNLHFSALAVARETPFVQNVSAAVGSCPCRALTDFVRIEVWGSFTFINRCCTGLNSNTLCNLEQLNSVVYALVIIQEQHCIKKCMGLLLCGRVATGPD